MTIAEKNFCLFCQILLKLIEYSLEIFETFSPNCTQNLIKSKFFNSTSSTCFLKFHNIFSLLFVKRWKPLNIFNTNVSLIRINLNWLYYWRVISLYQTYSTVSVNWFLSKLFVVYLFPLTMELIVAKCFPLCLSFLIDLNYIRLYIKNFLVSNSLQYVNISVFVESFTIKAFPPVCLVYSYLAHITIIKSTALNRLLTLYTIL